MKEREGTSFPVLHSPFNPSARLPSLNPSLSYFQAQLDVMKIARVADETDDGLARLGGRAVPSDSETQRRETLCSMA